MSGPYLKSGESIILTTDRVLIDDIEYDVILTSQRLALVDSGHTNDQPQVIPFAAVLSVKGGTTPAHEPFITLTLIDPNGLEEKKTLDLVFVVQPYEDRSVERDLWVQKLIEYIVSVRQEPSPTKKPQIPEKNRNMDPSVRRWGAPDLPQPHSQVVSESRRPSEELLAAIQVTHANTTDEPEAEQEPAISDGQSDEANEDVDVPLPVAGREPAFDEAIEKSEPNIQSCQNEIVVDETKRKPEPCDLNLLENAPTIEKTETITPEVTVALNNDTDMKTVNEADVDTPVQSTDSQVPVSPGSLPTEENRENPEDEIPVIISDPTTEPSGMAKESPFPAEIAPVEDNGRDFSHSKKTVQTGLPDTVVFPVISPQTTPDLPVNPDKSPLAESPASGSQSPVLKPKMNPRLLTAAIVLVILGILGGAAILFWHPGSNANGSDQSIITPAQTPLLVTTPTPVIVPADGVWVKVTYNGTFIGSYGNPGALRQVRGSGEQVYAIKNRYDPVQASFTKLDDYGEILTVGIYNNGNLVKQVNKSAPRGTISIMVDPYTGEAPYIPVTTSAA